MRGFNTVTAYWPSGSPTSSALPISLGYYGAASLHISGDWTEAHIGLRLQLESGVTFPYADWQAGWSGVSIPSASGNVSLQAPPNWFNAARHACLWSHDGTGNNVPQAAARTVIVDLKE